MSVRDKNHCMIKVVCVVCIFLYKSFSLLFYTTRSSLSFLPWIEGLTCLGRESIFYIKNLSSANPHIYNYIQSSSLMLIPRKQIKQKNQNNNVINWLANWFHPLKTTDNSAQTFNVAGPVCAMYESFYNTQNDLLYVCCQQTLEQDRIENVIICWENYVVLAHLLTSTIMTSTNEQASSIKFRRLARP
jgi:hypothetical protein